MWVAKKAKGLGVKTICMRRNHDYNTEEQNKFADVKIDNS